MKDKIMIFIIGILVGAVSATGAFYIYSTNKSDKCSNIIEREGGEPPEMPNGQNGQPPEKPDGENGQPPEMPSDNNTQDNS